MFVGAWLFFERTVWGKAFEAVAIDRRAAALMGINLRARHRVVVRRRRRRRRARRHARSRPTSRRTYLMGLPLAIKGFSALVIGGVGRVEGALLGGLLLALRRALTAALCADPLRALRIGVPLLLLIIFLLVRPTGLLRARKRGA